MNEPGANVRVVALMIQEVLSLRRLHPSTLRGGISNSPVRTRPRGRRPATGARPSSARRNAHLLRELAKRATDGHVCRSHGRLPEEARNLWVIEPEFDASENGVAVRALEPIERAPVSRHRLAADGVVHRRRRSVGTPYPERRR